jgi:hypothetical protein
MLIMTYALALVDANNRIQEWGGKPQETLEQAVALLEKLIGWGCECDNTHAAIGTQCCLCEYRAVLEAQSCPSLPERT